MQRFPSIKNNTEFRSIYRTGSSIASGPLVMYILKNDISHNRIGITASKKVGNSVVRHTFVRKIREIFRLNNYQTVQGYDILVVARKQAGEASYSWLNSSYLKLLSGHDILIRESK